MDSDTSPTGPPAAVWRRPWIWIVAAVALIGAIGIFIAYFAPEGTTHVEQDAPQDDSAVLVATGAFRGADRAHQVSGTVSWYEGDEGQYLRFEDYEATSGPDVYLFLSASSDGTYRSGEVHRILVPGGADGGQATLRGSFNVPVPAELDATTFGSLIVWCDDFSVKFGHAPLA